MTHPLSIYLYLTSVYVSQRWRKSLGQSPIASHVNLLQSHCDLVSGENITVWLTFDDLIGKKQGTSLAEDGPRKRCARQETARALHNSLRVKKDFPQQPLQEITSKSSSSSCRLLLGKLGAPDGITVEAWKFRPQMATQIAKFVRWGLASGNFIVWRYVLRSPFAVMVNGRPLNRPDYVRMVAARLCKAAAVSSGVRWALTSPISW